MAKVFVNGEIVDAKEAKVSVSDSGFLYGAGLFETMRCNGGKVFAIDDHLARLCASAEKLAINNPYDREYLAQAVYKTIEANELADARVRLTLTGGPMGQEDDGGATLVVTAGEFQAYPAEYYEKGVTVVLTDYRQNPAEPTCGHKTTNFFARLAALKEAHEKKAAEAIWFTTEGKLAEGCISNVFVVKDSVVYTPKVDTPVLPGVARKHVCEIAGAESIELVEKDLTIQELLAADEVFITNVIMLILPVVAVEAHTVGDGKVGEITKKLVKCFNDILAGQQAEARK
jgi:branched-chain amino acid aminotransferase